MVLTSRAGLMGGQHGWPPRVLWSGGFHGQESKSRTGLGCEATEGSLGKGEKAAGPGTMREHGKAAGARATNTSLSRELFSLRLALISSIIPGFCEAGETSCWTLQPTSSEQLFPSALNTLFLKIVLSPVPCSADPGDFHSLTRDVCLGSDADYTQSAV